MAAAARATANKEDPVQTAPAPFSELIAELDRMSREAELLLELTTDVAEVVTGLLLARVVADVETDEDPDAVDETREDDLGTLLVEPVVEPL